MLPAMRYRVAQRRLVAFPRRTFSTSTSTDRFAQSVRSIDQGKSSSSRDKIVYALGGTSIATIGLLLAKRTANDYADDARDLRALSTTPFGKLCSGWV